MAPPDDLRSSNQDGGRASCLDRQARASELYYEDFPELRPEAQTPPMPEGEQGDGWAKGMLDRPYPPLAPADCTRYIRGGDLWPGVEPADALDSRGAL